MKSKDQLSYIHAEVAALQRALETHHKMGSKSILNVAEMKKSAARLVLLLSDDRCYVKPHKSQASAPDH